MKHFYNNEVSSIDKPKQLNLYKQDNNVQTSKLDNDQEQQPRPPTLLESKMTCSSCVAFNPSLSYKSFKCFAILQNASSMFEFSWEKK